MNLRFGRIIAATFIAEIIGILSLVMVVLAFGPDNQNEIEAAAERMGAWVGPISGFVLCLIGGFWVARGSANPVINGLMMGCAAAVLDIIIALQLGGGFAWLLVVSNIGRILAGGLGGWIAGWKYPTGQTA